MEALLAALQPLSEEPWDDFDLSDLSSLVAGGSGVLAATYAHLVQARGAGAP